MAEENIKMVLHGVVVEWPTNKYGNAQEIAKKWMRIIPGYVGYGDGITAETAEALGVSNEPGCTELYFYQKEEQVMEAAHAVGVSGVGNVVRILRDVVFNI